MQLLHERSMMIKPWRPDGYTASGIYVQHHRLIMTPYGRVTHIHPSCSVRVGDFVVFKKFSPQAYPYEGKNPFLLFENQVLAVLEQKDGSPWFNQ